MTSVVVVPAAAPAATPAPRQERWRLVLAAVAGLVLFLAFPPVTARPLAPVAVALLALAVHRASPRRGAAAGLLFGLTSFLPLLHWTGTIAGDPAWVALSVIETVFLVPLGAALAVVSRLRAWPVWGACLWVGEEALRDRLPFGGFTWGRLAFSQDAGPLTALSAVGGQPLLTAAVALLGGLLALVVRSLLPGADAGGRSGLDRAADRVRTLAVPVAAAGAVVVAGLLVPTPTTGPTTRVALVQGNVPRLGLDAFSQRSAVLRNHVAATHRLAADVRAGRVAAPDLVVWPENASDLDPFTDPTAYTLIDGAVRDVGVPVLVGAVVEGPGDDVSNTGIVWDPATGPGRTYVKQHPVPFGEYMPYRDLLRRLSSRVDLVPRDFAKGTHTGLLDVGPARVGDVICFEVAYDGLVRDAVTAGGRVIVVQTNNATFGRTPETRQQLAMGRLRAVEHGRAVLVASTSGISAVIAPDGRVEQRSELFTARTLLADVPLRDAQTLATRAGAWPELLLSLAGAAALAVGLRRRREQS